MKRLLSGLFLLAVVVIISAAIAGESHVDTSSRLSPPSSEHIMGSDTFGRDLAGRIGQGVLVSLAIASAITAISFAAGIALSFLFSVWRIPNPAFLTAILTIKTVPPVILALFLNALSGPGIMKLVAVLSLGQMANIATTAYSRVIVSRGEDYVLFAEGLGKRDGYVFLRHILPDVLPYIALQSVSVFSSSILSEASLSFLGCGVPVTIPTLGSILSEARPVMGIAPWMVIFPALFLLLIGLSLEGIVSALSKPDASTH